ncbi:MAG: GYD domain-containing protein [Dehalococcoidia bacterium]
MMPLFMMLSRLTERGRDRVAAYPERIIEVNEEVEDAGCRVLDQFALMGEYDFATILETPDLGAMYRVAMDLGSRGTMVTCTLPAVTTAEFTGFMQAGLDDD